MQTHSVRITVAVVTPSVGGVLMSHTAHAAFDFKAVETPDEFRARVRAWFQAHAADRSRWPDSPSERRAINGLLYDQGMLGVTWPEEFGGRGLPTEYQTIFNEESQAYAGFLHNSSVTVGICAATLLDCGSEAQKAHHLPRMLRADEEWTQLLSEPGAGSDLASVATRARQDGDHFILSGQKVWTSLASESDFALALVRTDRDRPRHRGLSMLIVDMQTPGIDIRPLREMTGETKFSEVFIDDARVPVDNLVGELNGGWSVLITMLTHERIALSAGTTGRRMDEDAFPRLLELARSTDRLGDPAVRRALTEVYVQQRLLDLTGVRMREALEAGRRLGPVGSLGKIGTARAARTAAEAAVLTGGMRILAYDPADTEARELASSVLHFPMTSIAGGTSEIQKNTIAERLLGLPR